MGLIHSLSYKEVEYCAVLDNVFGDQRAAVLLIQLIKEGLTDITFPVLLYQSQSSGQG